MSDPAPPIKRVLLVGWDSADWKIINAPLRRGVGERTTGPPKALAIKYLRTQPPKPPATQQSENDISV